jgi:hypothetical protein
MSDGIWTRKSPFEKESTCILRDVLFIGLYYYTECDDVEHCDLTNTAYGALLVTTLRSLPPTGTSGLVQTYPALETLLREASELARDATNIGCASPYGDVCKAMGYRLFRLKTEEDYDLEERRIEEWKESLSEEKRRLVEEAEKEDE